MKLLGVALLVPALAAPSQAVFTDSWVHEASATNVSTSVEPRSVAVCHAEGGVGRGVIENDWAHFYSFHFVVATDCGAFPLDFTARYVGFSASHDHFVVTGPADSGTAAGECLTSRGAEDTFSCVVTQGDVRFEGDFALAPPLPAP